jgi:hypothetical protein
LQGKVVPVPKIKLAVLGQLPPGFDVRELLQWKSEVFELHPDVESFQLNEDAKGQEWEYTDAQLANQLKRPADCDIMVILVSVKLEHNWYARRLDDNRILFTFYELDQILRIYGLPLKNLALRVLYAMTLVYKRYGNRIPLATEQTNYAHDETRGCLFDMNASKIDVIHSLHQPKLCDFCVAQLKQAKVPFETLDAVSRELKKIRKPLVDRIVAFVREHTVISILLSLLSAIVLGVVTNLIASIIFESIRAAT